MIHLAAFIRHLEHPCVGWADEIQESIATVSIRLWVDWQVQKVECPQKACLADFAQKHLLRVLVREIAHHHGCCILPRWRWGRPVASSKIRVLKLLIDHFFGEHILEVKLGCLLWQLIHVVPHV